MLIEPRGINCDFKYYFNTLEDNKYLLNSSYFKKEQELKTNIF